MRTYAPSIIQIKVSAPLEFELLRIYKKVDVKINTDLCGIQLNAHECLLIIYRLRLQVHTLLIHKIRITPVLDESNRRISLKY